MRRGQKRQKIAKNRRRNPKQPTEPEGHRFKGCYDGCYDYEYWQKIIPRTGREISAVTETALSNRPRMTTWPPKTVSGIISG